MNQNYKMIMNRGTKDKMVNRLNKILALIKPMMVVVPH
jgi:hypothetical protein